MITLYWAPRTRAMQMLWPLEEVGQPYEVEHVDIRGGALPDAFREVSPLGKVPALRDGDAKVADSAAIMLYLADRYAAGRLAPLPDDPARGEFLFWLFYGPSAIEPAMTEKFADLPPNPAAYPWGTFDRMTETLDRRLEGREWISWDRFTVADIVSSGALNFLQAFKLHTLSPVMVEYRDRCMARPAAKAGYARDKEEAAKLD